MNRIARLPDDVINQIAAGEVVDRPASVVKELVENSLDADAARIVIDIEQGGKRLIRVRDDGHGIQAEDLSLAIERHATSKLRQASDLQSVVSSGFRGEALPSIGSVAELAITSRTRDSGEGASVGVMFSRVSAVRPAAHPVGTTVEVKNLFAEIPARRKFLKAESTETRNAVEIVSLLAMARSGIGFEMKADGREVVSLLPAASIQQRVTDVLGKNLAEGLAAIDYEDAGISVTGFASKDPRRGGARPDVRAFVNGRPVKDRGLSKAVSESYRALGHFDPKPLVVLFVDVGLDMVDVNVHPAKTEVRFRESSRVFEAVVRAMRRALSGPVEVPRPEFWKQKKSGEALTAAEPVALESRGVRAPIPFPPRLWESHELSERAVPFGKAPADATILGQFRDTYIVAVIEGDLWLFDQHTSHERARFEQIERRKSGERFESQGLLSPVPVHLPPNLALLASESLEQLVSFGFDVDPFGTGTVLVRAVPELLSGRDPSESLIAVLQQVDDKSDTQWAIAGRTHRLAASLACHSAVRAGQKISVPTMSEIVSGLMASEFQDFCPHGRPTRHRIPKEEVARWFERTGWRRS